MSIAPVAFSLMASFMSAITLLGVSSENYTYGVQFIVINISYGIFTVVAAYWYLPVFFKLQATSAYEVKQNDYWWLVWLLRNYFLLVPGIKVWESSTIGSIAFLYPSNDLVHGNRPLCPCVSIRGADRNSHVICHFGCRYVHIYFLEKYTK